MRCRATMWESCRRGPTEPGLLRCVLLRTAEMRSNSRQHFSGGQARSTPDPDSLTACKAQAAIEDRKSSAEPSEEASCLLAEIKDPLQAAAASQRASPPPQNDDTMVYCKKWPGRHERVL